MDDTQERSILSSGSTKDSSRATPECLRVDDLPAITGLSRGACYAAVNVYISSGGREGIPARRVGRRIVVPVALLRQWLGEIPVTSLNDPTDAPHSSLTDHLGLLQPRARLQESREGTLPNAHLENSRTGTNGTRP